MLNPIVAFFERIFRAIGHGLGLLAAWAVWPFLAAHGWYRQRNWMIKLPIAAIVALLAVLYVYFVWQPQQPWPERDQRTRDDHAAGGGYL
jgi:hypothetical protein